MNISKYASKHKKTHWNWKLKELLFAGNSRFASETAEFDNLLNLLLKT